MIGVKDVLAVLESLHVAADVPLADSIVRAHLAVGKIEVNEDLVRKYLIDGGTEIPAPIDSPVEPVPLTTDPDFTDSPVRSEEPLSGVTDDPDHTVDEDE